MPYFKSIFFSDVCKTRSKLKKKSGDICHKSLSQFPFLIWFSYFSKVEDIRVFCQLLCKFCREKPSDSGMAAFKS